MNTIVYHTVPSNSEIRAEFRDITSIRPIRVTETRKVIMYMLELSDVVYDNGIAETKSTFGLQHDNDYVEFDGKHYSYADMGRLVIAVENLRNKKALEALG